MPSAIDATKPAEGEAYTADVRANFATAAGEISALQDAAGQAATGQTTLGSDTNQITMSTGAGIPGPATPGFDQPGSQFTDVSGAPGALLYISDGTAWTAIG